MRIKPDALSVLPAKDSEKPIFANLLQLYIYDFAALYRFPIQSNGLYEVDQIDRFWEHPYLIRYNEELAGFAMAVSRSPIQNHKDQFFMAEFCILRPYQRRGLGQAAAQHIFNRHKGPWEVAWLPDNDAAASFWPKTLEGFAPTTTPIHANDEDWCSAEFKVI